MANITEQKLDYEEALGVFGVGNSPFVGILLCMYSIRYKVGKELTEEQKEKVFACLNIVAEDEKMPKTVRAWCYNQLGLIYANMSSLFKLS